MAKGDQVPMFPEEPPEQRRCVRCGTNYESIRELHKGGYCPQCGSQHHKPAKASDYSTAAHPDPEPEPEEPEAGSPQPGSTEDYLNE